MSAGLRSESLRLYRRVLREARLQADACVRSYAWGRATLWWRREAGEPSARSVRQLLHEGRASARALGEAAVQPAGPAAARLLRLAYGLAGRMAHRDQGKGPLMALPPDPAAWPASPVAGALLRRVPGLWRCGGTGSDGVTLPPPRQPRPPPAQHHPGWEESHAVLLDAVFLPALRAGRLCGAPACRDDDDDDRAAAGSGDAVPPRPVRRLYERVFGAAEAADRARRTARAAAKAARRGCEAEAAAAASAPLAGGATLLLPRPRLLLAGPLAAGAPPAFAGVGLLPRPLPPAPDAAAAGAAASAYAAPVQQTQTQTQTQSQKLKQPKQSQPKRQTQAPPWGKAKAGDG